MCCKKTQLVEIQLLYASKCLSCSNFILYFLQMASIEVSLSTTSRRKKAATAPATPTTPTTHTLSANNLFRSAKDVAQELELLRTTLRDKENVIHRLADKQLLYEEPYSLYITSVRLSTILCSVNIPNQRFYLANHLWLRHKLAYIYGTMGGFVWDI